MSDIFREVDEEVRQDRALAFWNRYQLWFLVAAALVVIATAGWRFHLHRQQALAEETGARYLAAVQASRDGRPADAAASLDAIAREGTPGYRQLAALRAADEYTAVDASRALKSFEALASDTSLDPLFRDVARLRAGMLRLDAGDSRGAQAYLTPLAGGNNPFRSTARELLAAAAISADDFETAGRWLDEIVRDPAAPQDVRGRAEAFLGLVRSGRRAAK
jgi:hypothetical protein